MNDQNTQRIIAACPSLFTTIQSEQESFANGVPFHPIAFGFECGDGWADLLVELCEKIQQYLNTLPKDVANDIVALQVKEKYGTLRFYVAYYDETVEAFIQEAEQKSSCICEQCGKPGKVRGSRWYYTACDEHTREEDLTPLFDSDDQI